MTKSAARPDTWMPLFWGDYRKDTADLGAAQHGATWQFCRPPVVDLEFEVDCRGVMSEIVLAS